MNVLPRVLEFHSASAELLGKCKHQFKGGCFPFNPVYAARDRAVVVLTKGRFALYDRSGERARAELSLDATQLAPSPSGRLLAGIHTGESGEAVSQVHILDIVEGTIRTFDRPTPPPTAMAWSPSGRRLAVVAPAGQLTFLEPAG